MTACPSLEVNCEKRDKDMKNFIASHVPHDLEHNGDAPFDEHLMGLRGVIRKWGADREMEDAAALHSIYGTQGFAGFKLSVTQRDVVREFIGARAERLVWMFCMIDRKSFDDGLYLGFDGRESFDFVSREELGRFPIRMTAKEYLDFVELNLADWLEQVEGAASKENKGYGWEVGHAWSFRREAYRQMLEVLLTQGPVANRNRMQIAKQMYEDVYSVESDATKHMHQVETPPLTQAAIEAREALLSAAMYQEETTAEVEISAVGV